MSLNGTSPLNQIFRYVAKQHFFSIKSNLHKCSYFRKIPTTALKIMLPVFGYDFLCCTSFQHTCQKQNTDGIINCMDSVHRLMLKKR